MLDVPFADYKASIYELCKLLCMELNYIQCRVVLSASSHLLYGFLENVVLLSINQKPKYIPDANLRKYRH